MENGKLVYLKNSSGMSNIESNKSQNGGLEEYNNISDGIYPLYESLG